MKNSIIISALSFFLLNNISCNNDDPVAIAFNADANANATFKAILNGGNEAPVISSAATGIATLIFNTTTKTCSLTIDYTGLTAISAYIHNTGISANNPLIFPASNATSPITYTNITLNQAQETALYANLYYINLCSAAFPNGEIRGSFIKQENGGGTPPPPPGY